MSNKYELQLYEAPGGFSGQGKLITATGGVCLVLTAGSSAKATITDEDGTSITNPIAMTNGGPDFYTANSILTVDVYILTPGGQFIVRMGIEPGHEHIDVDIDQRHQCMVLPFSMTDMTAATEYDTGFNEPTNAIMLPHPAIRVTTLDAGMTLDVGTDSTDSGNADGFLVTISVASATNVVGALTNGAVTLGEELTDNEDGSGALVPMPVVGAAKSITMELTSSVDTAQGFVYLPYMLLT